jgi:Domain of unknown function (DUF4430)
MTVNTGISRRAMAALTIALMLVAGGLATTGAAAQGSTVRLVIDYGDGTLKIFTDLPWSKGTTVLDVMNAAKAHPRGITHKHSGSGATAMLTEIDGQANQGGGSGRKNWQLWVNTNYADQGFGVYELQALDVVTWRFAPARGK